MIYKLDKKILKLRNRHFFLLDAIVFLITPLLSLILRLDGSFELAPFLPGLFLATILFAVIKLSVFLLFGFYRRYWRYASIDELAQVTILTTGAVLIQIVIFNALYHFTNIPLDNLPRSIPFLDGILSLLLVGALRFSVRAVERIGQRRKRFYRRDRVLIVGAGNAGISLVQEMQRSPQVGLCPVAFIDDDKEKLNLRIRGLSVVGDRYQIPKIINSMHIRQVIIAMPTAPGRVIREIVEICQGMGIKASTIPGINEILNGAVKVDINSIRDVKIEDLLRREPIETDIEAVSRFIRGKRVLITGAGGSIGSELCRQIFRCSPVEMILLGHGENSVFDIQQELAKYVNNAVENRENTKINALIADLRSLSRLEFVFEKYRPQIVFHAAAHKHVPLMELNPPEAVTNNIIGTKNLLDLALKYNVQNFVMISTDKAINPTNVMGASKRTAEMLVMQAAKKSGKPFVVVRFGNVLGSRGSVVPTFRKQIAAGGPITITHPDICRYFMTIPEAVQLVLQASVLSKSGEVFMLNMGQPVKIVDLAKDLIRLSGYEVGKDIQIVFTGLRPGEKLFEELLIPGEQYEKTQHDKLLVVRNASQMVTPTLDLTLEALYKAAEQNESNLILFLLEQIVPGYKPGYKKNEAKINPWQTKNLLPSTVEVKASEIESFIPSSNFVLPDLELALDKAVARQEFQLYYQPVLQLETGKVNEFEALLRWHHPEWGLISPVKFMSVAEATGAIVNIGWWVLEEVCRQLHIWQKQLAPESLTISINLSSRQFLQPNLVKEIEKYLQKYNLQPNSLRLDISESIIRENSHHALAVLPQIRALGIKLQMDNFGRNNDFYSHGHNFANLLYEQFDRLKVDRLFISRMDDDLESLEIVRHIAMSLKDSGIDMIAAGVETQKQVAQLRAMQCNYGQGYFFSKPVESNAVKRLIEVHQ